jgi:hypothetical protein
VGVPACAATAADPAACVGGSPDGPSYLVYPITTLWLTRPERASSKKEQVRRHITVHEQARPMTYCLGKAERTPTSPETPDPAKSQVRCPFGAPSKIRTCGLLLRSNPAADAVANWDDAGQVRGGAHCCSPSYLVITSRDTGRTTGTEDAARIVSQEVAASRSIVLGQSAPARRLCRRQSQRGQPPGTHAGSGLAPSVRDLVPAHKSGHPVHVASAVPGVSGRNREPCRFELEPPGPRLAGRLQRRTYQRQA